VCALFGVYNGWFAGRLAADLAAYRALAARNDTLLIA
jgi:hypothetical protein